MFTSRYDGTPYSNILLKIQIICNLLCPICIQIVCINYKTVKLFGLLNVCDIIWRTITTKNIDYTHGKCRRKLIVSYNFLIDFRGTVIDIILYILSQIILTPNFVSQFIWKIIHFLFCAIIKSTAAHSDNKVVLI